jgi:hypothetical protein
LVDVDLCIYVEKTKKKQREYGKIMCFKICGMKISFGEVNSLCTWEGALSKMQV